MTGSRTGVFRQAWIEIQRVWSERPWGRLALTLYVAYVVTVVANAWYTDDAYITFRVVDNLVHGLGPVWNAGERVQAYTNPLMMIVMSALAFVTREVYWTGLLVSIAASGVAVGILAFKVSRFRPASVVALAVLVVSNSFVAFSTSGLENCLTFLLLAVFFWLYLRSDSYDARELLLLTTTAAVLALNRQDTLLLVIPSLALAYVRSSATWRGRLGALVAGVVPFMAWLAFSVIYYGFPFPNTAYAKLNTGIPSGEYAIRGLWYYVVSFLHDPVALIALAMAVLLILAHRQAKTSVPLIGVGLYLLYIVRIGGDFMAGRFFTGPLFMVMLLLVSLDAESWQSLRALKGRAGAALGLSAVVLVLVQSAGGMLFNAMDLNGFSPYGIAREQAWYYSASGLPLNLLNRDQLKKSPLVRAGLALRAEGESPVVGANLGFLGYFAGPRVHIVDPLALSDPLLARMPAINNPAWNIGHATRYVPEGYLSTIETGVNVIEDQGLAKYYDQLALITRGGLWTRERWRAIRDVNLGTFDGLVDRQRYRYEVEPQYDIGVLFGGEGIPGSGRSE